MGIVWFTHKSEIPQKSFGELANCCESKTPIHLSDTSFHIQRQMSDIYILNEA